jgi:3-hydroxyisobutyrate dehydrogenase
MTRIAFFGAGRMGLPLCRNLVAAGHTVVATDVRPELAVAVRAAGASWAPDAAAAVAGADVVITALPGAPELHDLMAGQDGVLATLPAGTTWIDVTSSSPLVAAPLQRQAAQRGVDVLDAPMGGGVDAAREGTLQLFVGGDAGVLARVRPVLDAVADPRRIVLVGGPGAGYTAKLLVNLLWFGQAVATAEALLLGRRAGIDLAVLHRVLSDSAAGSEFVRRDLPALFRGDYLRSFGLDRCCEELDAVAELARAHDVPFALSGLVGEIHRRALARYGPVDGELQAVALLEEQAGSLLRT